MFGNQRFIQWDIEKADHASVTLSLRHQSSPQVPYDYSAWQTVSIAENGVTLELSVRHEGENPSPFRLGQYSFFTRKTHTRLTAPALSVWSESNVHLPDEKDPLPTEHDFAALNLSPVRFVNAFAGWGVHAFIIWPEVRLADPWRKPWSVGGG